MDMADEAGALIEQMSAVNLQQAHRPTAAAVAVGYCLQCGVDVEEGRRWCSRPCADAWEKENG